MSQDAQAPKHWPGYLDGVGTGRCGGCDARWLAHEEAIEMHEALVGALGSRSVKHHISLWREHHAVHEVAWQACNESPCREDRVLLARARGEAVAHG